MLPRSAFFQSVGRNLTGLRRGSSLRTSLAVAPFGSDPFAGVGTPGADGMTRLPSLDRVATDISFYRDAGAFLVFAGMSDVHGCPWCSTFVALRIAQRLIVIISGASLRDSGVRRLPASVSKKRLHPLPLSKSLFPLIFYHTVPSLGGATPRCRPVLDYSPFGSSSAA